MSRVLSILAVATAVIVLLPSAAHSEPPGGTRFVGTFTWVQKQKPNKPVTTRKCTGATLTIEGNKTYKKSDYGSVKGRRGRGCYDVNVLWKFEKPHVAARRKLSSKCKFDGNRVWCKVKSHPNSWPINDIDFQGIRQ